MARIRMSQESEINYKNLTSEDDLKKSIAEHIFFNKVYIVHLKFVLSCITEIVIILIIECKIKGTL